MKINEWELLYKLSDSRKWRARCRCGNEYDVFKSNVTSGKSKRCRKCQAEMQKETTGLRTHGLSRKLPKLYNVWSGIKRRCYNKNQKSYADYGKKGIAMCDEWLNSYESFYNWAIENGYKEGLEFDRIDSSGNYEPLNCRLITKSENISIAHTGRVPTINQKDKLTSTVTGLSEDDLSELIEAITSGHFKSQELADIVGVERHTLKRLAKRYGYEPKWRKGAFTRMDVDNIRNDVYIMSIKDIIKKYKSNHETIGCIINKRGTYGTEYYI